MEKAMICLFHKNAEQDSFVSVSINRAIGNRLITMMAIALLTLFYIGCAKQIEMIPNRKRPLPNGEVSSINQQKNTYQLKISHLLSPSELDSSANIFIIWASSTDE